MTVKELLDFLKDENNKIFYTDEIMAMPGKIIILPRNDTVRKEIVIDVRRKLEILNSRDGE